MLHRPHLQFASQLYPHPSHVPAGGVGVGGVGVGGVGPGGVGGAGVTPAYFAHSVAQSAPFPSVGWTSAVPLLAPFKSWHVLVLGMSEPGRHAHGIQLTPCAAQI